jgi:hypothetical protein
MRQPTGTELQNRIVAQIIGIIAVLVAAEYLVHTLHQQLAKRMDDLRRLAGIGQAVRQLLKQTNFGINLRKQHQATIAGDITAVKSTFDALPMKDSELDMDNTLCHTGETSRNGILLE